MNNELGGRKYEIRIIRDGARKGAQNMGLDEAVLEGVIAGTSQPTIRLYGWEPATLSIGYFQSLKSEVDLEACQRFGVDVLRRSTGGGAVFHQFEVTYSLVAPVGFCGIPEGILPSYQCICQGIICGLKRLGVESQFVPLNDIIASGKKVSGNAQTRRKGIILQHGTILLRVDVDKMFTVLKVPSEKMRDKIVQDVKQRVTGISDVLGREVGFEETSEALASGFVDALGCTLVPGAFTATELALAEQLAQDKYASAKWNEKR